MAASIFGESIPSSVIFLKLFSVCEIQSLSRWWPGDQPYAQSTLVEIYIHFKETLAHLCWTKQRHIGDQILDF
jgi:hypothetical protein